MFLKAFSEKLMLIAQSTNLNSQNEPQNDLQSTELSNRVCQQIFSIFCPYFMEL